MLCVSSSCFFFSCILFYFIFFYFFFFLLLNFQVCTKSFLVFVFFNRTKRGKCAIDTIKIYTPAPSFEKMFLLFPPRQTLKNMRFDWASYSSQSNWSNQTPWEREWVFPGVARRFLFLCWLLRLIRRGRRRHRLCIIDRQIRRPYVLEKRRIRRANAATI